MLDDFWQGFHEMDKSLGYSRSSEEETGIGIFQFIFCLDSFDAFFREGCSVPEIIIYPIIDGR